MRIWFDTEFIEDGKTIDLLSIGMVREDGETYYAEMLEADRSKAGNWVKENVLVHMTGPVLPRETARRQIMDFVGPKPEFWAYYADYDWVALCQLHGTMMDLPKGWPMYCRDVKQLLDETGMQPPPNEGAMHNALVDARWNKLAWDTCRRG